MFNFLV